MSPRVLAWLMASGLALTPATGLADPDTARRFAALRSLLAPAPPVGPATRPARAPEACGAARSWARSPVQRRLRIRSAIHDASLRFGVPARLIESVIQQESAWDVLAVSHAGARGLMQLMPETAAELRVVCSFDARENVLGGTHYLRRMYDRFGTWPLALAAYNAGPRAVAAGRVPDETRRYVARVMRGWRPPG